MIFQLLPKQDRLESRPGLEAGTHLLTILTATAESLVIGVFINREACRLSAYGAAGSLLVVGRMDLLLLSLLPPLILYFGAEFTLVYARTLVQRNGEDLSKSWGRSFDRVKGKSAVAVAAFVRNR